MLGRESVPDLGAERFELFFHDPVYLFYKNHLYNYLVRRRIIRRALKDSPQRGRTLELGCGISPMLPGSEQTVRTDVSWRALAYLSKCEASPAVACDATRLPLIEASFRRVVCSEVLEHIEKDMEVMREMSRLLVKGGELILTVPARPELFGFDDSFVGHYRRYELKKLIQTLSQAGFGNFKIKTVLGRLEKRLMGPAIWLFSRLRPSVSSKKTQLNTFLRFVAWVLFPVYWLFNWLLVGCVSLQARFTRPEKAVTILIRCQKQK